MLTGGEFIEILPLNLKRKINCLKKIENILNNKKILPYILISPVAISLIFTIFYPIFDGIRISFFDIKIPMPGRPANFIGFDNYKEMFSRPEFWGSFKTTIIYTFLFVLGSAILGILTALLLNLDFKGRAIARAAIIIPWAMPYVVAVLVWRWILDYNFGILNYILKDVFHFISEPIAWTSDIRIVLFTVIIIAVWKEFPIATVMYLAALQTVPNDLYEAAEVDGATSFQKFKHITLPMLKSVNYTVLLLLTIWGFKRVTAIYVLTKGGPARATETLVIQSYLEAFNFFHASYGAAIGTFMLVVSLIISIIYLRIGLRSSNEI